MTRVLRPFSTIIDWFFAPVDARTYAAVRISMAVSAFGVWLELWPMRRALFSEAGLFGPSAPPFSGTINLLALSNRVPIVDALFVTALLAILCLGLGIFVRVSAICVYLWAVSYSAQAPIALAGYDTVLRLTSFAVMLSPASSRASIRPQWFAGSARPLPRFGLRLMQWQLLLVYWCTVWLKAPDQYWRRGEVMSHMLMSNFARFPTPKAAQLGLWDPLLSWGTLLIELLVPVLLWKRSTRLLGAFLGFLLHFGIAASAKLALFSLTMVPLYLAYFEAPAWDRLGALATRWVRGASRRARRVS